MGEFNRPWIRASATKTPTKCGAAASLLDALQSALNDIPADVRANASVSVTASLLGQISGVTVCGIRRATPEEASELLRDSTG